MDGTNPKVSFIPKGSLVRETSFLERRRPRSVIGAIAVLAFIASVVGYAGLYFYSNSLENDVVSKTNKITLIQKEFSDAPQVARAQVLRARAEIAKGLLDEHTVVSPIFTFLSKNTISSILYERFSFTRGTEGATLELTGEAPTYAALASQEDKLRERITKELSKFEISNVSLTKFGTVTFTLSLSFMPDYLSYAKSLSSMGGSFSQDGATTVTPGQSAGTSTIPADSFPYMATSTTAREDVTAVPQKTEVGVVTPSAEKQSALEALWSRFKFW